MPVKTALKYFTVILILLISSPVFSADLASCIRSDPQVMNVNQLFTVVMGVSNAGITDATATTPDALYIQLPAMLVTAPSPATADIPAGGYHEFTWVYLAGVTPGTGIISGLARSGPDASVSACAESITIFTNPDLSQDIIMMPSQVSVGQEITILMNVTNTGGSDAEGVAPDPLINGCPGNASILTGPVPVSATVAAGANQFFTWVYAAQAAGNFCVNGYVKGYAQYSKWAIISESTISNFIRVQTPASLVCGLNAMPSTAVIGQDITLVLSVTNMGQADALYVCPLPPGTIGAGIVSLTAGPACATITGGSSAFYTWLYSSVAPGAVVFTCRAQGSDANTWEETMSGVCVSANVGISTATETETPVQQSPTPTITPTGTCVGEGSVDIIPVQVIAGSCGNTVQITYTNGPLMWDTGPGYGTLKISIPPGWSAPSLNPVDSGYFQPFVGFGNFVSQSVAGRDIIIKVAGLEAMGTIQVNYGVTALGGPGACAPASAGAVCFNVEMTASGDNTCPVFVNPCVNVVLPSPTVTRTPTPPQSTPSTTATQTPSRSNTPAATGTPTATKTPAPACAGEAGVDWQAATRNASFPRRHAFAAYDFDGKMWVVSGADSAGPHYRDAWWSTDGADWHAATRNAAFPGRSYPGFVTFNNEMWLIAGDNNGTPVNDVWHSSNGINWLLATGNAAFPVRNCLSALSYNGKMWVMCGNHNTGMPFGMTNDVWWSSDGAAWTQATSNAAFSPRSFAGAVTFDDGTGEKMWVIGGATQNDISHNVNDVWYSSDGVTWTCAVANAGFSPRCSFACFVYNGEIIVAGGLAGPTFARYNDVWASKDGINWVQRSAAAPFEQRQPVGLAYDSKAWVISGWGSSAGAPLKDAWYSCGMNHQTPTITVTLTVTPTPTQTGTRTVSTTPTNTVTRTNTYTITHTSTVTNTPAATSSRTMSPTATISGTITIAPSITMTRSETPTAVPSPVLLTIEKSVAGNQPEIGGSLTFTINIRNDAASGVLNLTVWDTLAENLSYAGFSSVPALAAPVVADNVVRFACPSLPAGGILSIKLITQVISIPDGFPMSNRAWCDYSDAVGMHAPISSQVVFCPAGVPVIYPNPGTEYIKFTNIVPGWQIDIYSLSGEFVNSIKDTYATIIRWERKNHYNRRVSAGIYYYLVRDNHGAPKYRGKLFILGR